MRIQQLTYRTERGGVKSVWRAHDAARATCGIGRNRKAALKDVKPMERRVRMGMPALTPTDYAEPHTPRCVERAIVGRDF